jgi:hypothetical protein
MANKKRRKNSFLNKTVGPVVYVVFSTIPVIFAIGFWLISLIIIPARQLLFEYRGVAYPVQVYVDVCEERKSRRNTIYYCHVYTTSNGKRFSPEVSRTTYYKFTPGSLQTMYQFRNAGLSEDGLVPGTIIIRLASGVGIPVLIGLFWGLAHVVGKRLKKTKRNERIKRVKNEKTQ